MKKNATPFILGLISIILSLLFYQTNVHKTFELKTLDLRFKAPKQKIISNKIVHIDIDDQSIKNLGKWPWERTLHVDFINTLSLFNPKYIVFDILFIDEEKLFLNEYLLNKKILPIFKKLQTKEIDLETNKKYNEYLYSQVSRLAINHDEMFGNTIKKSNNVFLSVFFPTSLEKTNNKNNIFYLKKTKQQLFYANKFGFKQNIQFPFPYSQKVEFPITALLKNTSNIGFVNAKADFDGCIRRTPLLWKYKNIYFPQLGFSVVMDLLNIDRKKINIKNNNLILESKTKKKIKIPLDKNGNMIINWQDKWASAFKHIPFDVVISFSKTQKKNIKNMLILDKKYTNNRLNNIYQKTSSKINNNPDWKKGKQDLLNFLKNIYTSHKDTKNPAKKLITLLNEYKILNNGLNKEKRLSNKLKKILNNKICIIGLTSTGSHDIKPMPLDTTYPMAGTHSNTINTILNNIAIKPIADKYNYWILILLGIFTTAILPFLKPVRSLLFSFLLISGYMFICFYIFTKYNLYINITAVSTNIFLIFLSITGFKYIIEEKQKRWIKHAFTHYLSPNLVNEIVNSPEKLALSGSKKTLSVLFADIRGFTSFSEKHTPEEVVAMLNNYLHEMTQIIFKHDGTLDKFVGDCIMVVYGAPQMTTLEDCALRAVKTAIEMAEKLEKLAAERAQSGQIELKMGIGINTGDMIVGNMGSKQRMDYTVIGDNVNLSARLEANAKGGQILISKSTYDLVHDKITATELEPIMVKGKVKPVPIWQVEKLK